MVSRVGRICWILCCACVSCRGGVLWKCAFGGAPTLPQGKKKNATFNTERIMKPIVCDTVQRTDFVERCIRSHARAVKEVKRLLSEKDPALLQTSSANQIDFWAACYQIPKGFVASYGTLSRIVQGVRQEDYAMAKYARAAGRFMAENPIAPIVPCHRVVGSTGGLTGFKGETSHTCLSQKQQLLKREGVPVLTTASGGLVVPKRSSSFL